MSLIPKPKVSVANHVQELSDILDAAVGQAITTCSIAAIKSSVYETVRAAFPTRSFRVSVYPEDAECLDSGTRLSVVVDEVRPIRDWEWEKGTRLASCDDRERQVSEREFDLEAMVDQLAPALWAGFTGIDVRDK